MTNIVKVEEKRITEKTITDAIHNKIVGLLSQGGIDLPPNYSWANALKSAYLILTEAKMTDKKTPVLEGCTEESIANALLDMVVQGLNPSKRQCYFIPYGKTLTFKRSYLGTAALTKRLPEVKDVKGYEIYSTDKFEMGFDFETGAKTIKVYEPSLNKNDEDIIGAVGIVVGHEKILQAEYVAIDKIRKAWMQGSAKGNSGAHNNFPDQMAIRTAINRVCKLYAETSDDSDKASVILSDSMEAVDEEMDQIIEENAGTVELQPPTEVVDPETGEIMDAEVVEEEQANKAPF